MSRLTNLALAVSASGVGIIGLAAAPASAGASPGIHSAIVGELGYEGGAPPGEFHPTAGTVEVEFNSVPLVLERHVGKSGHFNISLGPGSYTVFGCGPSKSAGQCSTPQNINLLPGEVDHIQLIWAYVP
ncbi:MAG TPA: hypothetical protein VEJ87_00160 [Acidimicrobiales bacterium]|nr:hypothetical protein [Acidimicrobiales bacterium]